MKKNISLIRAYFKGISAEDFLRGVLYDAYVIYVLNFFIKAYVVGTHLNCLDLSRQFK